MVGPIDVTQKGSESTGCYIDQATLYLDRWPSISRSNCISGMGGPIVMERKEWESIPWYETLRKWLNWMLHCPGCLWPWIFKVKLYLMNGRPYCHGMIGCSDVKRKGNEIDHILQDCFTGNHIFTLVLVKWAGIILCICPLDERQHWGNVTSYVWWIMNICNV